VAHDHILQRGAHFRETGPRLRAPSNAVKAWLIAYHECVTVRILCVAHLVEIQAIARFKSGCSYHVTHTQNQITTPSVQLAFPQAQVRLDALASINSLNFRSTSSATFASVSSWVRGRLTTIVSPVTGLPGSLVASPTLASRGACASKFSV